MKEWIVAETQASTINGKDVYPKTRELVRCKDCKKRSLMGTCSVLKLDVGSDFFCACGVKHN